MTELSLKERLAIYFRRHPQWISSGDIQRLVMERTNYTAQNVGRRLRELENDGVLQVEYRKSHAWYRAKAKTMEHWFHELPEAPVALSI
jgi:hypothetical protein